MSRPMKSGGRSPETMDVGKSAACAKPWLRWGVMAAIVLVALVAYSNSFRGEFVFDDKFTVVNNPDLRHMPSLSKLLLDFGFKDAPTAGRPAVALSFLLNYHLGELDPWGYHLFNLAVHALCGLALFGLVRLTLLRIDRTAPAATALAGAAALLWTAHPLHTSAVTYISQRAESLMALFFLLTLYCVARGIAGGRRQVWYPAAVLAAAAGAGCKEVGALAPVVVLLWDRAYAAGTFRAALRQRWGLYAGLAATWAITAVLLASSPRPDSVSLSGNLGLKITDYATTQANAVAMYLGKVFWPHPLVLDYGWPIAQRPADYALACVFLLALLAVSVWAFFRRPAVGFPAIAFFAVLAPSSSVLPILTEIMAEHRMYLPSAAVVVLTVVAAWAAGRAAGARWNLGHRALTMAAIAAVALGTVALAAATLAQNRLYHSAEGLWRHNLRHTPKNPRAALYLGMAMEAHGQIPAAVEQYRRALDLAMGIEVPRYPQSATAAQNLARGYRKLGRIDKALAIFESGRMPPPQTADMLFEYGTTLYFAGRADEAVDALKRARALDPKNPEIILTLGTALVVAKCVDEGLECYRTVMRLLPDDFRPVGNIAMVFHALGRHDDAARGLREYLRRHPDHETANLQLRQLEENARNPRAAE